MSPHFTRPCSPFFLTLAVLVLSPVCGRGTAQTPDSGNETVTVNGWSVHGYADGKEIGYEWFQTREEAEAAKAQMEKVETTNGKYYDRVEIQPESREIAKKDVKHQPGNAGRAKELLSRVKEAKEAVDRAKRIANGDESLVKAEERKLGDTLKEYKAALKRSYDQVTGAKKTLTTGASGQTEAKVKAVNGLIDKFNRGVDDLQGVMGADYRSGYSKLPRVEPPDRPPTKADVVGTWEGASAQGGHNLAVSLVFNDDGTVTRTDSDGNSSRGEWKLDGSAVAVTWSSGDRVTWPLKGRAITASGATSRGRWSASFQRK
jgi:hypothetical protein